MDDHRVFRSRRVMLPLATTPASQPASDAGHAADVVVRDGNIVDVVDYGTASGELIDVDDRWLLPGLVDTHVHINEPGRTQWEGFATATRAAKSGGFTTLVDMPLNSSPVTISPDALQTKRAAAEGQCHVDVAAHAGLVPESADSIQDVIAAGAVAAKAFLCPSGIDEFPHVQREHLKRGMDQLARIDKPLLAHAEIASPIAPMTDPTSYQQYLRSRPDQWEADAIAMLIDLSRQTGCAVHIVHLASATCLPMIREAREDKLPVTVETCPHYLCLDAESIPDGATQFKCAPPIRSRDNQDALWNALQSGDIDMIVSDHSPCPPDMKHLDSGRFDLAWGGIASLQIGLPLIWTAAQSRRIPFQRVVDWMSTFPAALVGLPSGIRKGNPAHLFVFDDQATWKIDQTKLHHRHAITPYHGHEVIGRVEATYVHGVDHEVPQGRFLS
ncbi:MAG: allantoinase AllB [Planctomycetota bacterium]